jgi:D-alanine transaminase
MGIDMAAVNGHITPLSEARISVLDLGFLRGTGAFETLATFGRHPHGVKAHLDRLQRCCEELGIAMPFEEKTFRSTLVKLKRASGWDDLRINVVVSPGDLTDGVFDSTGPNWVVIARELHTPSPKAYSGGIKVITFPGQRAFPHVKTTAYVTGKRALEQAKIAGAAEAIYQDSAGALLEGVTSNFHAIFGTRLVSPARACLNGLTRGVLRELALQLELTWDESDLTLERLKTADEAFITSAAREVLPVVQVNAITIGSGAVGPWARKLLALHHARAVAEALADAQAAGEC